MRNKLFITMSFAILVFAPTLSQAATRIDDPVKFVKSVYAQLAALTPQKTYQEPEDIYTPHLAALWALEKKDAGDGVGTIDFDFWVNGQDWTLSGVNVTEQPVDGSLPRKIVIVKFKNFGKPQETHFYFEKTDAGWKLDDARSLGMKGWTLSLVLKYGWDSPL
ncbi:MAG TPA: hypothetical protein VIJ85_03610 [Rhizomicrobium sp.]